MATLKTGDFSLRALPQVPRINPANFDAGIGNLIGTFDSAMQLPARLEGVRSVQRRGRLERAMEPQTLELAQQRAAQELELAPYETAARKQRAIGAFDQPGGSALYYDAQGNLVQDTVTIETDPVTGEQFNVSVPSVIKTAEQVAQDRETTAALAQMRLGNVAAAQQRADAATTSAKALADLRKAQAAAIEKGGRGRTTTQPVRDKYGRSIGTIEMQQDATGKTIRRTFIPPAQKDPVSGEIIAPEPVDLPMDEMMDAGQAEVTDGSNQFKINMPGESGAPASRPALPVSSPVAAQSPAPPAPVSPVNLPTLSPQQALSPDNPPGQFLGTDGVTYEKGVDGKIRKV